MSQPKNSIIEIIEAARKTQHLDDATLKIAHLAAWLEQAIETLVACEAVQDELARVKQQLEHDNQALFQDNLNLRADLAIVKRRLVVASQPTVETAYTVQYCGSKGWKEMMEKIDKQRASHHDAPVKRSHKKKPQK
jgi:hypothetical protein